mgnify:CR=1 FL=1
MPDNITISETITFHVICSFKNKYPKIIKEVRGRGFLIGLKLHKDQSEFIKKLMNNKKRNKLLRN